VNSAEVCFDVEVVFVAFLFALVEGFFVLIFAVGRETFLACPSRMGNPVVVKDFPAHIITSTTLQFGLRLGQLSVRRPILFTVIEIDARLCKRDIVNRLVLSGILDHALKVGKLIREGSEKGLCAGDEGVTVDQVVRVHVDQFEEFIVGALVVEALFDLLEEGDFIRRDGEFGWWAKGFGELGHQRCVGLFHFRLGVTMLRALQSGPVNKGWGGL